MQKGGSDSPSSGGRGIPSARLSLRRNDRLRRASEIQALFRQGNRDERTSFVALWRRSAEGRRVGFAVSRRIGSAVMRNRGRRRLREAYRREQGALHADVAVMFVARPAMINRRFADLLEEMRRTLGMLNRSVQREKVAKVSRS